MSINDKNVLDAILDAIDSFNKNQPRNNKLTKSKNASLVGVDGELDSLGLVSFFIEVEQQIEEKFNISLTIAIDDILFQDDGPFQSIGSLSRYCLELINKAKH